MDDNPFELSGGGAKASTEEVDTSKLDFDYVASCTNASELLSILRELESGRHGIFPGLQKAVEDRLLSVMTPVDRARYVALKGPTRDEVYAAHERGKELAAELAALEKANARAAGNNTRSLPPVRTPPSISHPLSIAPAAVAAPVEVAKRVDPKSKPFSEAYGSWDKFDVDKALNDADADFAAEERKRDAQRAENDARDAAARAARAAELRKARLPANLDSLDPAMRAQYAEREKTKGNEAFKTASFEEAVASYTRSLAYDSTSAAAALVFSNRAQARLKLNLWESAEDDASAALAINADNAKAWMRRGTARLKRGRYADAAADLRHLVSGAVPSANDAALKEAKKLLAEVDAKLKAVQAEGGGGASGAEFSSGTSSARALPEGGNKGLPESTPGAVRRRVIIQEGSDDEEEDSDTAAPAGVFTGTGISRAASAAATVTPAAMKKLVVIDGGGDDDWGSDDDDALIRPAAAASTTAPTKSAAVGSAVKPPPVPPPRAPSTATTTTTSTPTPPSSSISFREEGNAHFKALDFARAVEAYAQAATAATSPTECSAALSNRAQALLKLQRWVEAETDATLALELERVPAEALAQIAAAKDAPAAARALVADRDPAGAALLVKLLHRRALARRELGALVTSLQDLTVASALEPANQTVKSDLLAVRARVKAATAALQPQSAAKTATIMSPTSAAVPLRGPADAPKPPLIQAVSSTPSPASPPTKPVTVAVPAKKTPAEGAAGGARAATSPTASVVAAAAAAAKALPPPPRSATDFELSVGGLRRSTSTLFKWLRASVTGAMLKGFFEHASLDAELLGRVAGGLAAGAREGKLADAGDVEWVRGVIAALDGARGASTAADMLGDDERGDLDAARRI